MHAMQRNKMTMKTTAINRWLDVQLLMEKLTHSKRGILSSHDWCKT